MAKVKINTEIPKDRLESLCKFTINNGVGNNGIFTVYGSPTANCQICSIASFVNIFGHLDPNAKDRYNQPTYIPTRKGSKKLKLNSDWYNEDGSAKINYDTNAFMKIMQAAILKGGGGGKFQMLIDIRNVKPYIDFIDKTLEKDIVFKQPYKSTNGSNMVMYLIRTQSIRNYK